MSELQRFVVVAEGEPASLVAALAHRAGLVPVADVAVRRVFLDTADGRLHAAGGQLEWRVPVGPRAAASVVWTSTVTGETLGVVDLTGATGATGVAGVAGPVRTPADLPSGPVVDRLAELVEMRTLLPQGEVMSRLVTMALVDGEGKTTVRVVFDHSTLLGPAVLPAVVEVHPVRGYARQAERLGDLLRAQVTLQPSSEPLVDVVRQAAGAPPFLSSKLRLSLDRAGTAEQAWRDVFAELTATVHANVAGTRDDTDSEFLHDLRVAVRRIRSVLQEGRGVLPDEARERWRVAFKWLGDITTPTRDADVHLLDYPSLVASLPPERAADLAPLHGLLVDHQRQAHDELVAHLDSPRAAEALTEWGAWLAADWADAGPDAGRSAPVVVAARVQKAWRRVVRDGRRIDDAVPAEALHDLRKDAKRLRYLLECFGSVLDPDDVAVVVKALKGLQDCLGEFQDTEVQAGALGSFGDELVARGDVPAATLLAMGGVVEHLDERGRRARARFAERFAAFDHPDIRRRVRRLVTVPEGTDE